MIETLTSYDWSLINNKDYFRRNSEAISLDLPEGFASGGARGSTPPLRRVLSELVHQELWPLVDGLLLEGVDINSKNADGQTVLHEVAAIGSLQAIIELKKRGADFNAQDNKKCTPLHYAVSKGSKQIKVVEQLITCGANVQNTDDQGRNAAHYTAAHGHESVIECLAKHQINFNQLDARKQTPLQLAVERKSLSVTDAIIAIMKRQQDPGKHALITQLPRSFYASRRLYYVFGGTKLKSTMADINQQSNGGIIDESISFLVTCLAAFIADKKPDQHANFETILKTLKSCLDNKNSTTADLVTHVKKGTPILVHSGFIGHALMALLRKQEDKYILSIMDRGALSKVIPDTENCHSIRRIEIPEHLLIWTLSELKKLKSSDADGNKTENFLFVKLPSKVNADYQSDDELQQKLSKDKLCYFHAIKAALLELFVMQFGKEQGHKIYKEFTLYAREKSLESYQINVSKDYEPNRDQVIEECHRILEQKRLKLANS